MSLEEIVFGRDEISKVPRKPGVYIFRGIRPGTEKMGVLYIGKAVDLRARVRQYFMGEGDGRAFSKVLQAQVSEIKTIVVTSEEEALILENELIKRNKPPYNILLKDDKRFLSLRLDTKHEWPRIEIVRKIKRDGATYLGPFSSTTKLRSTLEFMQRVFPLRTCDDRKLYNRSRPCLEYEIKRCVAPCVNFVTKKDYLQLVESAILFLKGCGGELVESLKHQMELASEREEYERAARLRDQIAAIESTQAGQNVVGLKQWREASNQDAIGFARQGRRTMIVIVFIRSGIIIDKRTFEFMDVELSEDDLLSEFLERYYSQDVYIPDEVLVRSEVPAPEKIKVLVPRSDEKKGFLNIAQKNAEAALESAQSKAENLEMTIEHLRERLSLSKSPKIIDCVDISHHQGSETVASVVRFENGKPQKSGYRKIRLESGVVDDYASIREAVTRRYRAVEDLPDLLVIDGGRGQLSSAKEVLQEKGWLRTIDLVSLAKARDREGLDPRNPQERERIFKPGQKNPILLKRDSAEELLLRYLRDEAHRFAITFHRHRKENEMSHSVLDSVPGISEKIKIKLLSAFGSIDAIRSASDEELRKVVSGRVLEALRKTLNADPG